MLTGLYDAKVDGAPVLSLSGQVPSKVRGRGAFQDLDLNAAFADVAEYSQTIQAGSDHAEIMSLACKTALVRGTVGHVVLPDEVQTLPSDAQAKGPAGRIGATAVTPPAPVLEEAIAAINKAERPLIVVGAGARSDMATITKLAEHLDAPVATTFKAKGQISDSHPLGCGVLGRSGTPVASWFMNESDLILAFGTSFSNHTGIAEYKRTIQVDRDPMALGRFHSIDVPLLGDIGVTADFMAKGVGKASHGTANEVAARWRIWRAEKQSRVSDDRGRGVSAAALFATLSNEVDAEAVISVDVGNNTYSFGRYFEVDRQRVLMSGYLGSIGFGFAGAMGAWAAMGDTHQIVGISGDGGFGQYGFEFTTAVKYNMNITHVLLNNSELGKISKEQRSAELDVWQTSLVNPDFAAFARLCGGTGINVTHSDQLETALADALAHDGPVIVDVATDVDLL